MPRLTLRDYQEECVQAHYDFFARNAEGNPLFVVPTGGGKSLIIAEFVRRSLEAWPDTRFLVLTHVKELIQQNHDEFVEHWGGLAPAGIYSAGLGRRDSRDRVTFAGIQSVWRRATDLGPFDLVLIDEAHLIPKSGEGRYRHYLTELRRLNPDVRACGYTATPFRLDGGYLHKGSGGVFTEIAYDVKVDLLVERGYLVPLVAKRPERVIDTTHARTGHGDFKTNDLEAAALDGDCVEEAVAETVRIAREQDRKALLFFGTTIKHAERILGELDVHGVEARGVFGHTSKAERDEVVQAFRDGKLPALVNVGVLTTGFNAPRCDLMAVMRPTQSASLYVQMMGRGMRTFPGKVNCLVLDYGENVERHGPINRVRPRTTGEGGAGDAPMKVCPACRSIVLLGTKLCPDCGHEWPPAQVEIEHRRLAGVLSPYDPDAGKPRVLVVDSWSFRAHEKLDKPTSLRVDYQCGMRMLSEWVCLEHPGFAGRKAARWWTAHSGRVPLPLTVTDALTRTEELRRPQAIEVVDEITNGKTFERVHRPLFTLEAANGAAAEDRGGEPATVAGDGDPIPF